MADQSAHEYTSEMTWATKEKVPRGGGGGGKLPGLKINFSAWSPLGPVSSGILSGPGQNKVALKFPLLTQKILNHFYLNKHLTDVSARVF